MGSKIDKVINNILKIYKGVSLSDLDVLKLVKNRAKVLLYKDLKKYNTLDEALGPHEAIFLLYETKPQYGHWTLLFKRKDRNGEDVISFFDSYGEFPDNELAWNDQYTNDYLGQNLPFLSKLIIESPYENLEYDDHRYQKMQEGVSTCGRWAALRLICRVLSPEKFKKLFGKANGDDLVTLITELLKVN